MRLSMRDFGLLAVAAVIFSPLAAVGQDSIYTVKSPNTNPRRGNITAMTPNEVKYEQAGVEQTIQVNEIAKIRFSDEPTALTNARNAIDQKNYNSALNELDKVNAADLKRDFEKQELAFLRAFCQGKVAMTEGGSKSDAEKAMLDFVRASNKNHYRFYESAELLGELAAASGKYDEAAKYYGDAGLGAAPWPEYKLKANLALGRAQQMSGKADEALQNFDAVIASDISTEEALGLKRFAQVGRAACLAEQGKPDEGITILKDIIAKENPQDTRLFARANNALGNCYLKANKPKEALLAFLQTDILFFADAESHAEALYRLSKLWDSMNKSDRANDARSTLRQRYAGSNWVNLQ